MTSKESPTQVTREEFEAWVAKNRKRLENQMANEADQKPWEVQ